MTSLCLLASNIRASGPEARYLKLESEIEKLTDSGTLTSHTSTSSSFFTSSQSNSPNSNFNPLASCTDANFAGGLYSHVGSTPSLRASTGASSRVSVTMAFDLTFGLEEVDLDGFDDVEGDAVVGLEGFEDFADFEDFDADADVDAGGILQVDCQDYKIFRCREKVKQDDVLDSS